MSLNQFFVRSLSSHVAGFQLALRASVSAAMAVLIARMLGLDTPLFAMIAAVIVTDLSPASSRQFAVIRLVGTLLGAVTGAALSGVLPAGPVGIAIGVALAMLISHFMRLDAAAKLTGYLCALVMLTHADDPWAYALHRLMETTLGICIALAVSLVPLWITDRSREGTAEDDKL